MAATIPADLAQDFWHAIVLSQKLAYLYGWPDLLEDGELDGCEIECPRHGGRFDVRNGAAVALPAMEPVRSFPLHVRGDQIVVALEDA